MNNVEILKTKQTNTSGIYPTEYKVLIKPKAIEEEVLKDHKALKAVGFVMDENSKEREQFAVMEGELVAVSPLAFTYEDWKSAKPPQVGDKVIFAKFAGTKRKGKDGVEYRIVADKDIAAVID